MKVPTFAKSEILRAIRLLHSDDSFHKGIDILYGLVGKKPKSIKVWPWNYLKELTDFEKASRKRKMVSK